MSSKTLPLIIALIVILAVAVMLTLTSPGQEEPRETPAQERSGEGEQAGVQGEAAGGTRTVRIVAVDYEFQPSRITLAPGEKVTLVVENQGRVFHTLTIDELGVDLSLNPGEVKEITLEAPDSMVELTFYCRPHKGLGMTGTLTVS